MAKKTVNKTTTAKRASNKAPKDFDMLKAFIGYFFVKSDIWIVNMVGDTK